MIEKLQLEQMRRVLLPASYPARCSKSKRASYNDGGSSLPANIFDLQAQSIYCENASFSTGVKSDEFCESASAMAENPCRCRDFVQFG